MLININMQFDLRQRNDHLIKGTFSREDFSRLKGSEAPLPILIALTGNDGGNPRDCNAFTKIIRHATHIEDINVIGMTYPYKSVERMNLLMTEYNCLELADLGATALHRASGEFVEKNLQYLYAKDGKQFYTREELQQKFRAVNIAGYSFGAAVATALCNNIGEKMLKYGYNTEDAKAAVANIAVVTIGAVVNYDRFLYPPRCIHIVNAGDEKVYDKGRNLAVIAGKLGLEADEYLIEYNGGHEKLIPQLASKIRPGKICRVIEIDEKQTVLLVASSSGKATNGHGLDVYFAGEGGRVLSAALNIISANAVDNTRLTPTDLVVDQNDNFISCEYAEPEYKRLPDAAELETALHGELKRQALLERSTRSR